MNQERIDISQKKAVKVLFWGGHSSMSLDLLERGINNSLPEYYRSVRVSKYPIKDWHVCECPSAACARHLIEREPACVKKRELYFESYKKPHELYQSLQQKKAHQVLIIIEKKWISKNRLKTFLNKNGFSYEKIQILYQKVKKKNGVECGSSHKNFCVLLDSIHTVKKITEKGDWILGEDDPVRVKISQFNTNDFFQPLEEDWTKLSTETSSSLTPKISSFKARESSQVDSIQMSHQIRPTAKAYFENLRNSLPDSAGHISSNLRFTCTCLKRRII